MEPPHPSVPDSREAGAGVARQTQAQQAISNEPSMEGKTLKEGEASSEPVATASFSTSLPVELLIEVFRYLSSSDVVRLAQVSGTWHAASEDRRLWRHLSFTTLKDVKLSLKSGSKSDSQVKLLEILNAFRARCSDSVESVDFSHLRPWAVKIFATNLLKSTESLKHIYWRPTSTRPLTYTADDATYRAEEAAALAVNTLARLSPQLETLELSLLGLYPRLGYQLPTASTATPPSSARPRYFRLSLGYELELHNFAPHNSTLLDHVSTFEFTYASYTPRRRQTSIIGTYQLREMFAHNPAIEKLTVHGLCRAQGQLVRVSAPSLRYLDLRSSTCSSSELKLDAPMLRELTVDGRLLLSLTPASTAMLSSLTLHVVSGLAEELQGAVKRIRNHVGSLKLTVALKCADEVLELLSRRFLWPGLAEVDIKVFNSSINDLVGVIAARQVGTLGGATKEQYYEVVSKAKEKLPDVRTCQVADYLAEAEEVFAMAGANQNDARAPPLCTQVRWKIIDACSFCNSARILDWLSKFPNVSVEKL